MLITTVENNIAIVQLNNGKVNAISHQLIKELKESFLSLAKNSIIQGVILTGNT
jgi:3,2-trans-enoyl-CoA isomerase